MPLPSSPAPSRRSILKGSLAAVSLVSLPAIPAIAGPSIIRQLYDEIAEIDAMTWPDDDASGDVLSDRQTECEIRLVMTPARTKADILLKARVAERQAEEGEPTAQPYPAVTYLIEDLERLFFLTGGETT